MLVGHVAGSSSCAGATMPARPPRNRYAGNAGHGVFDFTDTVNGSTTVTSATFEKMNELMRAWTFGLTPR